MEYLYAIDLKVTEPNTPTNSALQHASDQYSYRYLADT